MVGRGGAPSPRSTSPRTAPFSNSSPRRVTGQARCVAARELADRLRTELGVGPAPTTRALLARLCGPGAVRRRGRAAPMFGRSAELTTLTAAWSAARRGRGRVVVVTGEAGIGKTRLVRELARRADNAGARVAVGAGVDVGGEAPLAMWQELARALVAVVPQPPDRAGWPSELGRLAPDLTRGLGRHGEPPVVAAPELERLRVFDAVLRLVEWAAGGRPVLLVAEDVHRADRASIALCAHIGRRLAGMPVLFVLTRRDRPAHPEIDALLADLAGRGLDVAEVELGPLRGPEIAEVVRSVTDDVLPGPVVDDVVAAAEGNPLLAVESARATAAGSSAPPRSLRAVVRAALRGLPEPARALAEAIAAAGRALTAAEIAALPATAEAERQILDTGLAGRAPGGLRYRHALLAEAARADLSDPEGTHLAVALAVEAGCAPGHGAARAAEVARHLQLAGRDDLAGPRWQRAARHARELGALPEATAFWTEAVLCDPDDGAARLELAEVHAWSGRTEAFEQEWEHALARLAPADRAAAWSRRGHIYKTVLCRPSASLAAYRRAAELSTPDTSVALRVTVLIGLAWSEASAGDAGRSGPLLAEAAALVPDPDDDDRGGDRDRPAVHRDPPRPVRRMRRRRAAGGGRRRPRATARPRPRRLDPGGVRPGLCRRSRRSPPGRRPGGRDHARRAGTGAAVPGCARPPALPARTARRGGNHRGGAADDGGAARLGGDAGRGPARRGPGRARRRALRRGGRPARRGSRRERVRQPAGDPPGAGRGAGRVQRRRRRRGRAAPGRPGTGRPRGSALGAGSADGSGPGARGPGTRRRAAGPAAARRGRRRLAPSQP